MVDAVVGVFLETLVGVLKEEGRVVLEFHDQFQEMKRQLNLMKCFLKDVDRKRRRVSTLQAITDELRELVYDAEDILADCSNAGSAPEKKTSASCLFPFSTAEIPFRSQAGKRLREINGRIKQIEESMKSFLSTQAIQNSTDDLNNDIQRWSSPVFDQTQIVGLDGDAEKIKEWLFGHDNAASIIGIVGMGGLGKTTTAQKVFNDKQVEDYFEKRIWVSVSQTFVEEVIMKSMLKNLGDASIGDDKSELLRKIHLYLQDKRYLIVLDDVWSIDNGWWGRLSDGLPKRNGSCIMITTRKEDVAKKMGVVEARIHRPKFLTTKDSWTLFSKIAFAGTDGVCQDSALNEIGWEIVDKCGGLPLAIKAVGGVMLCKDRSVAEWRRIAQNFSEELAEQDGSVMASLQLSYDELPTYLKSCFLCFVVYPEDCVVIKDQLIHWWMGEGFLPASSGRSLVEIGEDCFTGLLNRCLVEVVERNFNQKVYTCKIHDMVRDLVFKVAAEEGFSKRPSSRYRRLGFGLSTESMHLKSNSRLRALVSTANKQMVNMVQFSCAEKICDCRHLRVLDISESIFDKHAKDVLCRISSLHSLAYLNLRNVHPMAEVPLAVDKLKNLQVLDLSSCHNLTKLPSFIVRLEKLVVLDVSCCGSLKYLPKGLSKLTNLQVLRGFRPSRPDYPDGCCMRELKSLNQLRTLELLLSRGDEIAVDEFDSISCLQSLQDLTISCFDSCNSDLEPKLEQLCVPRQLSELTLKFFPGEATPTWLSPSLLPLLQWLSISHSNFAHFSTNFWGHGTADWRLHGLMLEALPELEVDWAKLHGAMTCLQLVSASWCPKLQAFPIDDIEFKGGVWKKY